MPLVPPPFPPIAARPDGRRSRPLALTLAGMPGRAQAGASPQPICWGPENSPPDCPPPSLMDPYTYGKSYYRQPHTYGYDRRYYQNTYPYSGCGPVHGR